MTEENILSHLLKINNNCDQIFSPKLQPNAVNQIAKNVTDIIYESLSQKSSASSQKRGNLLVSLFNNY